MRKTKGKSSTQPQPISPPATSPLGPMALDPGPMTGTTVTQIRGFKGLREGHGLAGKRFSQSPSGVGGPGGGGAAAGMWIQLVPKIDKKTSKSRCVGILQTKLRPHKPPLAIFLTPFAVWTRSSSFTRRLGAAGWEKGSGWLDPWGTGSLGIKTPSPKSYNPPGSWRGGGAFVASTCIHLHQHFVLSSTCQRNSCRIANAATTNVLVGKKRGEK